MIHRNFSAAKKILKTSDSNEISYRMLDRPRKFSSRLHELAEGKQCEAQKAFERRGRILKEQ